jgi:hypothetical protein
MLSNEQLRDYNHRLLKELQNHLNIMEDQCRAPSPDVNVIALEIGKCMKIYSLVSYIMGIYDGVDKTQGGFRESVRAHSEMTEADGDTDFSGE